MRQASAALEDRLYEKAVMLAGSCWQHVDAAVQYEHKYLGRESTPMNAFDLVLKYAPLLLLHEVLDKFELIIRSKKQLGGRPTSHLREELSKARQVLQAAHALWERLEGGDELGERDLCRGLEIGQAATRDVLATWEVMGLVRQAGSGDSRRLRLTTRLNEMTSAKCPTCGTVGDGPKAMFFEPTRCPNCGATVLFVLFGGEACGEGRT